jgi:hypothetical protein
MPIKLVLNLIYSSNYHNFYETQYHKDIDQELNQKESIKKKKNFFEQEVKQIKL